MTPELVVRLPAAIYGIASSDGLRITAPVAGVPIMTALASEKTSFPEDGQRLATEPADVQEPAPAALLALGLAALAWRMRRRGG
jgi:MYXO-CTERM domain-containing protein